eukprot:CAMPEP_0194236204 /NCGR_PEP_ID=MMETSP0158-20130606/3524_1 /TAXON_ID=33649 /ORGANISM="Thalassionema nitzschioides, Strain L26-B" /LENGTH=182 /DNA_ID=CAMNT_0038969911 /DNA_START=15 /DNA_END=560 /DNA_ORIENTATION=-
MSEVDGTSPISRKRPFILVTGTPCVGKTATASLLAERSGFKHMCVGDLVKEHKFYDGLDEKLDSYYLDEEKLLDYMETSLKECDDEGLGVVCDYHSCELFPERWFDLVLVLRAKTDVLFDRLSKREYSDQKRQENLECEIMQVVLDEAKEAYAKDIVIQLPSNTIEEMESNIQRAQTWVEQW